MWKISIETSQQRAAELSTILEDYVLSASWFEIDEQQDLWNLDVLFDEQPENSWLQPLIGLETFHSEFIPTKDWVIENQASFPAIHVGPFYIYGSHICNSLPPSSIHLKIDASTAFGTGEHATTQGCLHLLNQLEQDNSTFHNILDLGCGTGILGMAAAYLFNQKQVLLSDNDPEAVIMTQYNIEQNNLINRCHAVLSEGFQDVKLQDKAPFDLIIANILAKPLVTLVPEISKYSTNNANIILSGLLVSQVDNIVNTYRNNNFKLVKQYIIKEWSALWLRKEQ